MLNRVFKWFRQQGRNHFAARRRSTADAQVIAESVVKMTETVKQELVEQRRLLGSLVGAVKPKKETGKRFLTLVLATILVAMIVLLAADFTRPAFSSPPPNYGQSGVASLYVWANSLNEQQDDALQNSGISLTVTADQRSSKVEYTAMFPARLAGDRFVLATAGIAVLSGFRSTVPGVTNEYPRCLVEGQSEPAQRSCQLITGIIPGASGSFTTACGFDGSEETVTVRFSGDAAVNSSYDWAHHITSLPYLGNVPGTGPGSVNDLVVGAFGDNFPPANLTTCYYLGLNPDWMEYVPNFTPTYHIGDNMAWVPASNMASYLVVSTERSAEWWGNVLLLILGVFGPTLLTLIGMTARSGYRLFSQTRRP